MVEVVVGPVVTSFGGFVEVDGLVSVVVSSTVVVPPVVGVVVVGEIVVVVKVVGFEVMTTGPVVSTPVVVG